MSVHDPDLDFSLTLRSLLRRPTHVVTPGWLSKITGIPKATIVNWLDGRVNRPRGAWVLPAICDALRLSPAEARVLYDAAGETECEALGAHIPFDRVPLGLYVTTFDGRVVRANTTLIQMLGYGGARDYLRLNVARDLYCDPAARARWVERICDLGTVIKEPVLARRADGSALRLLDTATVVFDERGRPAYFEGAWERE